MDKFKVGDIVKIIGCEYPNDMDHTIGTISEITKVGTHDNRKYTVPDFTGEYSQWVYNDDELELANYVKTPLYKALNGL